MHIYIHTQVCGGAGDPDHQRDYCRKQQAPPHELDVVNAGVPLSSHLADPVSLNPKV